MKNLFKKSLACCLAVCMVLTLCIGALTANAEAVTGTVTVGTADVTTAATTATVDVTVEADALAAAKVAIAVPDGLTITGLALAADEDVTVTYASAADPTGAPVELENGDTSDVAPAVVDDAFNYVIHLPANTTTANAVVLSITFAGTFAEGKIDVAVASAEACYDAESDLIALTLNDGAINVAAAHVHNYVGTQTKAPTCTEAGVMTYACTCGVGTYTEEIPVIPHTEEEIPAVPATCTTAGATAGVKCSVCQEVLTAPTTVDALGHAWNEGEVTTAPDCDDAGVKTYTCANDPSHTKEEAIDALGHTAAAETVKKDEVAATCTTDGSYRDVVVCEVCGAEISSETITVKATGHNFGDNLEFCANNCGTENPDYVAPCAHANTTVVSATPAVNGGAKGSIVLHCDDCDVDLPAKEVSYYMYYQFSQNTLSSESEVVINFKALDMALNFQGGYDDIFVKVGLAGEEGYKGSDAMAETIISNNSAKQWSFGLKAYEYTCDVNCTIFAYHDGAWYSGPTSTTSVAATANILLADSGVKETEKNMLANLLDYGEKAQLNFGRYTEKLATANMAAADKARIVTTTAEYADTHINNFNANTEKAIVAQCSVAAESKVTFRYTTAIAKTVDINTVTAKISFVNAEGETVTTTIDSSKFSYYAANNTHTMYVIEFSNFAAYDLRRDFTLNVYEGETLISCDVIYSVESLVAILNAGTIKDTEKAMYNSLLHYGDLANTHFKG